jgi:hypothetical protein
MKKISCLIFGVALTFTLAVLPALAQQRRGTGQRDPLAGLERALQAANAPALSAFEQSSITSLISQYQPLQPSSDTTQRLEAAILGNTPDPTDTKAITDNMTANFQNRANFAAQVAKLLDSNGQLAPLRTKFGDSRTVQILQSLVGGGFGPGRGFGMAGVGPSTR